MSAPAVIDRVKRNLVGLKMPRALEILDVTVRGIERGEITAIEAIDALLTEELTLRENRRVKMALQMAKLSAIKTLTGFDFAFQPSLDKNRVMALAGLQFIDRAEAVHLIGPPGTGKTHLSLALGVEAVKAGRSVYFSSLADIVASLARAEREGALRERIRYFCRFALLIVDEIGYLPVIPGGGNLFFQLVNARYERGAKTFALTAIAYLQPVTRGEISKLAGREISRDVIAALKRCGLIDGAIRAPQPGAPFAYVTTRKFLEAFGFASLRDLPDLERLKAEGLLERGQGDAELDDALGLVNEETDETLSDDVELDDVERY